MIVNDYSTVWACANGPTVGMNGIYVEGSLYVNGTNTTVEGRATYRPVKGECTNYTHYRPKISLQADISTMQVQLLQE